MMNFSIYFTESSDSQMDKLSKDRSKKSIYKAVCKTIGYMENNLKHPSLNTHEYHSVKGPNGEKVFESYAQNRTPGAYRIFWCYGPEKGKITILDVSPHP